MCKHFVSLERAKVTIIDNSYYIIINEKKFAFKMHDVGIAGFYIQNVPDTIKSRIYINFNQTQSVGYEKVLPTSAVTFRYPFLEANQIFSDYKYLARLLTIHSPSIVWTASWSRILSSAQEAEEHQTNMESFLDPKVEQLLAKKSDTERLQAIAFSIACLCTGPTPFQPPDYFHIPKSKGKNNIKEIW